MLHSGQAASVEIQVLDEMIETDSSDSEEYFDALDIFPFPAGVARSDGYIVALLLNSEITVFCFENFLLLFVKVL